MSKKSFKSVLITMALFLSACQATEPPLTSSEQNGNPENIKVTTVQPVEALFNTEEFTLPNCGGTGEIRQTLGATASISKNIILGGTATIRGGGEIAIPAATKLMLETEIEAAYQKAYESANSRLDTIDMPAAAGTHVIYEIGWYEQTYSSFVNYSLAEQVYEAEYVYKLQVPKINNSHQIPCETPTQNSTNNSQPNTPEPPEPTATSETINRQQNTGLAIGQWFAQGNLAFMLESVDFVSGTGYSRVRLTYIVKNVGNSTISFQYSSYNFRVHDNLGTTYPIDAATGESRTVTLDSGQIKEIANPFYGWWDYEGNYANTDVTEVTLVVTDLSQISYAEWVIPISH